MAENKRRCINMGQQKTLKTSWKYPCMAWKFGKVNAMSYFVSRNARYMFKYKSCGPKKIKQSFNSNNQLQTQGPTEESSSIIGSSSWKRSGSTTLRWRRLRFLRRSGVTSSISPSISSGTRGRSLAGLLEADCLLSSIWKCMRSLEERGRFAGDTLS